MLAVAPEPLKFCDLSSESDGYRDSRMVRLVLWLAHCCENLRFETTRFTILFPTVIRGEGISCRRARPSAWAALRAPEYTTIRPWGDVNPCVQWAPRGAILLDIEIARLFAGFAQLDETAPETRARGPKDFDSLAAARAREHEALSLTAPFVSHGGFCGGDGDLHGVELA